MGQPPHDALKTRKPLIGLSQRPHADVQLLPQLQLDLHSNDTSAVCHSAKAYY